VAASGRLISNRLGTWCKSETLTRIVSVSD
jgi:hypothetical protein